MKNKYKVKCDWGFYSVFNNEKQVCSCDTKYMAYKIKKLLEMIDTNQRCYNCINEDLLWSMEPCCKCDKKEIVTRSHFQPKESK